MKGFLALQRKEHQPQRDTVKKCDLMQTKAIRKGTKKLEGTTGKKVKNWMHNVPEKRGLPNVVLSTATNANVISQTNEVTPPSNVVVQLDWSDENLRGTSKDSIPWYVTVVHEQKCMALLEEKMELISALEDESAKKDVQITTLQNEVENLTQQFRELIDDDKLKIQAQSVYAMENELETIKDIKDESKQKDLIIADLRDQIWQLGLQIRLLRDDISIAILDTVTDDEHVKKPSEWNEPPKAPAEKSSDESKLERHAEWEERASSPDDYRRPQEHLVSESVKSVSSVKSTDGEEDELLTSEDEAVKLLVIRNEELEKKVKEMEENYNMSTGTVSTLNRKLSRTEDQLRNTETAVARLQKELSERCSQLQDMSNKFSSLREENNQLKTVTELQNENVKLREMVAKLQAEATEARDTVGRLKEQTDNLLLHSSAAEARKRQLQEECDTTKAENRMLQRNLQEQQVVLQATSTRLERFISRMVQAIYSAPGIEQPTTEITDEDTLRAFKKILDERLEFYGMLTVHEIPVQPLFTGNTKETEVAP